MYNQDMFIKNVNKLTTLQKNAIYNLVLSIVNDADNFIDNDDTFTKDEIESIIKSEQEAKQGKTFKDDEINWNEIGTE